jgi:hypothetical protein
MTAKRARELANSKKFKSFSYVDTPKAREMFLGLLKDWEDERKLPTQWALSLCKFCGIKKGSRDHNSCY